MTAFAASDFSLLDDGEAIELVVAAASAGIPFSLIRLGDGEGIVLSYSDHMWLQDLAYLHGHWGTEGVTLEAIAEVRRDLEVAIHGADIVGLRSDVVNVEAPDDLLKRPAREVKEFVSSRFHVRPEEINNLSAVGARRLAILQRALAEIEWSQGQKFCSAWIHWELLASGALNRILEQATDVGLVTARPEIEHLLARRFDVRTKTVIVPDKFIEAGGPDRHVPDRYRAIRPELSFPEGSIVLVGAGIPGKAYCQWLKEAGCVAIDIGSVFDVWVGKASRPRVLESRFKVPGGNSVPRDLQLRPPAPTGDRQLIPRWKPSGVAG